ncbi:MAG: heparan-alpha-glucosaminide N-acetyltransferase domain-containing protein, partial [Candidatus Micrarchaeota archaeon]
RFFYLNLVLGIAAIFAGLQINKIVAPDNLLMWVGLYSRDLHTLDYFPLLPWFGIVLIGMFVGKYFYSKKNTARMDGLVSPAPKFWLVRFFIYLGRKSLLIYLMHQPILICLLIGYILLV